MVFAAQESSGHVNPFVANVVIQLAIAAMFALFTGIPTVIAARRRRVRVRNHEAEPVYSEAAYREAAKTPIGSPEALRIGRRFAMWLFVAVGLVGLLIGLAGLDADDDTDPAMKWVGFGLLALSIMCVIWIAVLLRRYAPVKNPPSDQPRPRTGFRGSARTLVTVGVLLTLVGALMLLIDVVAAGDLTTGELAWGYLLGVAPFALGMLCFVSAEHAYSLMHIQDVAQLSARRCTLVFGVQTAVVVAAFVSAALLHDLLSTDLVADDQQLFLVVAGICVVLWLISGAAVFAVRTAVRALAEALPAVPASGAPGIRQN